MASTASRLGIVEVGGGLDADLDAGGGQGMDSRPLHFSGEGQARHAGHRVPDLAQRAARDLGHGPASRAAPPRDHGRPGGSANSALTATTVRVWPSRSCRSRAIRSRSATAERARTSSWVSSRLLIAALKIGADQVAGRRHDRRRTRPGPSSYHDVPVDEPEERCSDGAEHGQMPRIALTSRFGMPATRLVAKTWNTAHRPPNGYRA